MICIWCLRDLPKLSREHAIPEPLACPPDLVLDYVACTACNNALSRLDRVLVKQFEVAAVMMGVRRKKGRRPKIDGWRSIASRHSAAGPEIFINAGPGTLTVDGKTLHPAAACNGMTDVWHRPDEGKLGFSLTFGRDAGFLPALYKIGLNLVARHLGPEAAASPAYNHVRAFVKRETGAAPLTVGMVNDSTIIPTSGASGPLTKDGEAYPMFQVTILGIAFLVDLSPAQQGLRDIAGAATLHGETLFLFPTTS